ncbi:MAG TPA: MotA/TolQ/ExbB proton channel family protein [Gemmataceae bacterium]|nr:MotA/TolQ/ExbB proton channel family protein [Gemmataceae bacterium]
MRRFWIHQVLPVVFCLVPVLAAVLVFVAVPTDARDLYLKQVAKSPIDWIIISLGFALFAVQTWVAWRALRWRPNETDFDPRADRWLAHLSQAAEWFPLLGLIGTVAAILLTFNAFGGAAGGKQPSPSEIIHSYAPAITATGGGLYMALINILPSWVVGVGRDLIRGLAGIAPAEPANGEAQP